MKPILLLALEFYFNLLPAGDANKYFKEVKFNEI